MTYHDSRFRSRGGRNSAAQILSPSYEQPSWLEKRPSTIPKAGDGLFTTVPIAKGRILGRYGGKVMDPKEWEDEVRRAKTIEQKDQLRNYAFEVQVGRTMRNTVMVVGHGTTYPPGQEPTFTRYVNHAAASRRNTDFHAHIPDGDGAARTRVEILLVTTRAIAAGEEILTDYGYSYNEGLAELGSQDVDSDRAQGPHDFGNRWAHV